MAASQLPIQTIANLVQGVSQQAPQNRRDTQCESQFDCINSALLGVAPRPGGELLRYYSAVSFSNALFSETAYQDENYLAGVNAAGLPFALDLSDGTLCTVTSTAPDYSYLTGGAELTRDKLRAQVVDDYTFILNRDVSPAMLGTVAPSRPHEALIFVRATAFNTKYTITLVNAVTSVVTTAVFTTSDSTVHGTDFIASSLFPSISGINGYTALISGSTIYVTRPDGVDFTIDATDGGGDTYMKAFKETVQDFASLPAKAFAGVTLKVRGEDKTSDDDYYVQFQGNPSTGSWVEVVGPGVPTSLNAATMPHALVNTGYRAFEFRRLAYSTRIAGDTVSVKDPGFVGKFPRDLLYWQRRLGIIWPGGVVFSKTDFPYTYFPDTVQTVLATAPVDIKIGAGAKRGAAVLDFALQAQENLYLWAQKAQYRVSSGQDPFKQDSVEVTSSMSYSYSKNAIPLPLGAFVFFTSEAGPYAGLRALQYVQTKLAGDVDVTAHVPRYIKAGVRIVSASETLRYVFIQQDNDPSVLYQFSYTYDATQGFIQSAINTWRIPGGSIVWHSIIDNYLLVLQQRADGAALLRFDLTPAVVDPDAGSTYSTRLDLRLDETDVTGLAYDASTGRSSFTLPYAPLGSDILVVTRVGALGGYGRGHSFPGVTVAGSVVSVLGNLTGVQFYVGQRITAERTESPFYVRSDKGALPVDRLDINRFFLSMAATSYTRIEVTAPGKTDRQYVFEGRTLVGESAAVEGLEPRNGELQAPVGENSRNATIRIVNDTFLPSYWQSAAYSYTAVGWGGLT